jgi:glyoxylase-like metal-dependent hydrolase (beta-lactamase superfamily II)
MQEITPQVFIENSYAGVTIGIIKWSRGLILIDAPFRTEDIRCWRSAILSLGSGLDRLLVNLDAHLDRTLGARAMECTVIGHEKMSQVFRNRPLTFKSQTPETGAEWEKYNNLGSIRWAPPEISFTERLTLQQDDNLIVLEHLPGPSASSIWINLVSENIVFVGDAVIPHQPPYLANADLPVWKNALRQLLSTEFQDYIVISGRGGMVNSMDIRDQLKFLEKVEQIISQLIAAKADPQATNDLVEELIMDFPAKPEDHALYRQRLQWGLHQYYLKLCQLTDSETEDS